MVENIWHRKSLGILQGKSMFLLFMFLGQLKKSRLLKMGMGALALNEESNTLGIGWIGVGEEWHTFVPFSGKNRGREWHK
jgi:hypothetical protein